MANNSKNKLIIDKLLEDNRSIKADKYEHVALYAALFQNINGALADYGFDRRATLDIFIKDKVTTMMTVIDKIVNNPAIANMSYAEFMAACKDKSQWNLLKPSGLTTNSNQVYDEEIAFKHIMENGWLQTYMPFTTETRTVVDPSTGAKINKEFIANKDYAGNFVKGIDRTRSIAQDLSKKLEKTESSAFMLEPQDARDILEGKRSQLSVNYDAMYKATKGSLYRSKLKDDGSVVSGNGSYYDEFMGEGTDSAVNKLKEKNRYIRRGWGKFLLKGLGVAAAAALTVASGGALLAYSGVAFTTIFTTSFSGMGLASALTAGVGTFIGGSATVGLGSAAYKDMWSLITFYRDKRDFMQGVGKYNNSGGKVKGYRALEKRYYSSLAMAEYFQYGEVRTKKAKKFFTKEMRKKADFDNQYKNVFYVNNENGTYKKVYDILDKVCMAVPGNKDRNMTNNEVTSFIENVVHGNFVDALNGNRIAETTNEKLDLIQRTQKIFKAREKDIGEIKVAEFENGLAQQYLEQVREALFHEPFNPSATNLLKARISKDDVKALLKQDEQGDGESKANAYFTFFDMIRMNKKTDGTMRPEFPNGKLGVSIEQQFKYEPEIMESAARRVCDDLTDAEVLSVNSISDRIINMTSKSEKDAIKADIDALARVDGDEKIAKVRDYLDFMLTKKTEASKHSEESIKDQIWGAGATLTPDEENVAKVIAKIKRDSTTNRITDNEFVSGDNSYDKVRTLIQTKITDPAKQKIAYKLLDEQTISILNKEFNDSAAKFMPTVMKNRAAAYLPKVKKLIDGLKIDGETTDEQLTISGLDEWVHKNNFMNNLAFKPVLETYLRIKIEELLITKAQTILESDFDKIIDLVKTMNNCHFIDQSQKIRIIEQIEPKIKVALDIKLKDIKEGFMTQKDMSEIYKLYNPKTEQGALREVFKINSPGIQSLKDDITNIVKLAPTRTRLSGDPSLIALGDQEAKDMATALMDSNKDSVTGNYGGITTNNNFFNTLKEIDTLSNNVDISNIAVKLSWYLSEIKRLMNEINDPNRYNNKEKYLLLITLKNSCISAYKKHMSNYFYNTIRPAGHSSFNAYFTGTANGTTEFISNVYDKWSYNNTPTDRGVIDMVDDALDNIINELKNETGLDYTYDKAKKSISKSTNENQVSSYYNSQTM